MSKYTTAYKYDEITFEYKYNFLVQENPLKNGEYLMPEHTTLIEPPEVSPNEIACFFNNQWVITADFRGQNQINLDTMEITQIDYIGILHKGFQLISEDIINKINEYPTKYKVVDGVLRDISDTEEYKRETEIIALEKEATVLKKELNELDTKRIRAVCEPSVKNEETGETWLEFYNNQICEIRIKINDLNNQIEQRKNTQNE